MKCCNFVWSYIFLPKKPPEYKLTRSFNFTYRYIYCVLSHINSKHGDYVDRSYPIELEIKDIISSAITSWLDIHLYIDSEELNFTTTEIILIFALWPFHLHVAKFQKDMLWEYSSLYVLGITKLVVSTRISVRNWMLLLTRNLLNKGFIVIKFK